MTTAVSQEERFKPFVRKECCPVVFCKLHFQDKLAICTGHEIVFRCLFVVCLFVLKQITRCKFKHKIFLVLSYLCMKSPFLCEEKWILPLTQPSVLLLLVLQRQNLTLIFFSGEISCTIITIPFGVSQKTSYYFLTHPIPRVTGENTSRSVSQRLLLWFPWDYDGTQWWTWQC